MGTRAVTLLLAFALLTPCASAESRPRPPSAPVRNPVYAPQRWSKDPFVLKKGADYFLFTTDVRRLHVARSSDLANWTGDQPLEIEGESLPFLWAPSVIELGGAFYLYYSAGRTKGGADDGIDWPSFRLRVAKASRPLGPYRLVGDLLEAPRPFAGHNDAGVIDGEVVRGDDGKLYCFYVVVLRGIPERRAHWEGIRVRRLASPTRVDPASPDTRVIDPEGNDTWQQTIVEAPTLLRAGGRWALLYSGGSSKEGQAIGVAYSSRLMGGGGGADASWTKQASRSHPEGEPIFSPDQSQDWTRHSIGSTAVIKDPAGRLRLIYQGLDAPEDKGGRWTVGLADVSISRGRLSLQAR